MYRILVDAHMIGDRSGGNESYYVNAYTNMKVPDEYEISLILSPGVDDSPYKEKYRILRFKSTNPVIRNLFELPVICFKERINLLHTQYFIPFIRPCKTICTIHDICFEHYSNIFTKREYLLQRLLIPYAAKHSQRVLTVSEYSKNDISERYKVKRENIIVTYSSVNDDYKIINRTTEGRDRLTRKFGIGNNEYIITVGNLQPRKNLTRLIKAYKLLVKRHNIKHKLVIVGKKAWLYTDILKEASQLKDRIVLTDYVSNEDLCGLYNYASCFVYPSFFEGFGLPPAEAMACGTPVVVSKATSLPEVVGDAGLYFDPYNIDEMCEVIYRIIEDEELRNKMTEAGKKRAEKFSPHNMAVKILKGYSEILPVSLKQEAE